MNALRGRFIVFDGPDGAGKTTQYRRFQRQVEAAGIKVCEVREPGGTHIGEEIRRLLLDLKHVEREPIALTCEMLLFMASRAQLVAQRIAPALERGELVLADRFISSTLAYQGTAGGLEPEAILAVGRVALGKVWPDLVVIFDVDAATARARLNPLLRGQELDRMEGRGAAFHERVRAGYLNQIVADPQGYRRIDARCEEAQVQAQLFATLADWVASGPERSSAVGCPVSGK